MKSISFIGVILLVISIVLFYLTTDFNVEQIRLSHIMGIMGGIGIGLILGGLVGYLSKGSAIREEEKRRELKQLRKEKEELVKQAAELERQNEIRNSQNQNPQF